ncbi:TPR repeat protein [gamma proteobacterium IMCC2047]|nr:TPR repeat protein [gamma proteobacterium IMCC2047]
MAKKSNELAGDRPEVIDTYGWILLHNGDKKKALTLLQDSVSKAPENPDIRYHLAQAMYDNGKYQQSKKELDRLLRDYSGFSEQAAAAKLLTKLSAQLEIN